MNLIKNASVYEIHLPATDLLAQHFENDSYVEIKPEQETSVGFVDTMGYGYASTINGVVCFTVQYDEKVIPGAVVKQEVDKRVKEFEDEAGCKPGRKILRQLKSEVRQDIVKRALVNSTKLLCFYHRHSKLLIVPSTSKKVYNAVASLIINSVGAAKTETINISELKGGITKRTKDYVEGNVSAFDGFSFVPCVWLERDGEKVSYKIDDVSSTKEGLLELLTTNFQVNAVRLSYGTCSFNLDSEFKFKSVSFEESEEEFESKQDQIEHEIGAQVVEFVDVVESLCVLFDYKEVD